LSDELKAAASRAQCEGNREQSDDVWAHGWNSPSLTMLPELDRGLRHFHDYLEADMHEHPLLPAFGGTVLKQCPASRPKSMHGDDDKSKGNYDAG
jgi:hypothetical protein